jgi:hypothetical protein
MKIATKIVAAVGLAAMLASKPLLAGDGKTFKEKVVVEEERKWWGASLSTGWDSLYMFRGVNILRGNDDYGSSLYWTDLSVTWNITDNDFLTVGVWQAFGIGNTAYKETDAYVNYTHTFGNLAASFGYIFYYYGNSELYQNELNWKLAYTIELPAGITIVPSLTYYLNLGPDYEGFERGTGAVETASSYLLARIDAGIPIYKDIVSLAPWFAFGSSFDYNAKTAGNSEGFTFFTGANNIEFGIGLPIKINDVITVYGYGAYSYQWEGLLGTEPSTFWGGAKVTFSF